MLHEDVSLYSLLKKAKPRWANEDVCRVRSKLHKVNITDAKSLSKAVFEGSLNAHLQAAGERRLKSSTLAQLKIQVRGPYKAAQLAEEKVSSSRTRRCFCNECLLDTTAICKPSSNTTPDVNPETSCHAKLKLPIITGNVSCSSSDTASIVGQRETKKALSSVSLTSSLPALPRLGENAAVPVASPLQQVGESIAGRMRATQGSSEPSRGKFLHSTAAAVPGKCGELVLPSRLRRIKSEPATHMDHRGARAAFSRVKAAETVHEVQTRSHGSSSASSKPRRSAPAIEARPTRSKRQAPPPPFIARNAEPMVPGGMRHDDDALEDLLRVADGYLKRGYITASNTESTPGNAGDFESSTLDPLHTASENFRNAVTSGHSHIQKPAVDDDLSAVKEAARAAGAQAAIDRAERHRRELFEMMHETVNGSEALQKAVVSETGAAQMQTGEVEQAVVSETGTAQMQTGEGEQALVKKPSVLHCDAIKTAVGKAGSAATGSTVDSTDGSAPLSCDTSLAGATPVNHQEAAEDDHSSDADGTFYSEDNYSTPGGSYTDPEAEYTPATTSTPASDGGNVHELGEDALSSKHTATSTFSDDANSQRSARTVDRIDGEGWDARSFIGTGLLGGDVNANKDSLRIDGLLNCLEAAGAASSVANSEEGSSPREVPAAGISAADFRNGKYVHFMPERAATRPRGGSMTGMPSGQPLSTEGELDTDLRAMERRARWIDAYDGRRTKSKIR